MYKILWYSNKRKMIKKLSIRYTDHSERTLQIL
uniref:Uncharacterized protein n=1 Tax=Arundo donax TaxID=35708 RepID=A0A0A9FN48_ARUDO